MIERIRWSLGTWLIAALLNFLISITIWGVLDTTPTLVLTSISLAITFGIARRSSIQIEVTPEEFKVGKAHIGREFISKVVELDKEEMKRARGSDLDPAAFLVLKPWIKTGIKIFIRDDRDPTPYWLVSCRDPKRITQALGKY